MRIGWATPSFQAGKLLGSDRHSYAFDGHLVSWGVGGRSGVLLIRSLSPLCSV